MAVTRSALARWVGAVPGDATDDAMLDGLIATAGAMVLKYAAGAPESVREQATLRTAALLWYHRGPGPEGRIRRINALSDSGAKGILSAWRRPSFVVAGGAS